MKYDYQLEIDQLVRDSKHDKDGNCDGCGDPTLAALDVKRQSLLNLNRTIDEYLKTH